METLNLDLLPDEAKREIINHYNELLMKYSKKDYSKSNKIEELASKIDKLSWNMGEKLYTSREDLHDR